MAKEQQPDDPAKVTDLMAALEASLASVEDEPGPLTKLEWAIAVAWLIGLVAVPWALWTVLSAGWAVLGFFVIAVGLPAYAEWRHL